MDVLIRGQSLFIRCLLIKLPMGHTQFFYYNYISMMDLNKIKIKFSNIVKLLMGHIAGWARSVHYILYYTIKTIYSDNCQ